MTDLAVLIVADNPLARLGMAGMLGAQPGLAVAGQASSSSLADAVDLFRPQVIMWDWGWSDTPQRLAGALDADIPVLALVDDTAQAAAAWSAGARGLLPHEADIETLTTALGAVAQGLVVLHPALTAALIPAGSTPAGDEPLEALTPREREVLQLLAEGLPNKTIAARLGITDHTVKFHVNAIMTKLGVQSRTEAVVRATRLGLILL